MVTYEWDQTKATTNERKHGVGFSESSSVFDHPLSVSIRDPDNSEEEEEDRWITVGRSATLRERRVYTEV